MPRCTPSAITLPVLRKLCMSLEHTTSSFYQRLMFKAMFLTAFYGFLRVGEFTLKRADDSTTVVQFRDLVWLVKDATIVGAKLTLIDFKHNTSKRPFSVHIVRQDSDEFCPFTTLQEFCSLVTTRGLYFARPVLLPFLHQRLMLNCEHVWIFLDLIQVVTSPIVSELAQLLSRPKKAFRMPKSGPWDAGSLMPLRFIYGRTRSQISIELTNQLH